ncbi:MAG: T9SS type A sorting domain-containing protein [Melioribacteraceae bacterium]|nr:T9SS type A sorting domain-containing protein [Melioribacteraceae bacterium]
MKLKLIIIILFISTLLYSENYRKVKITISNSNEISELQKIGIPLDHFKQNRDGSIELFLNEQEFTALNQTSVQYNVLIDNWAKHYNEQNKNSTSSFELSKRNSVFNVEGFTYGSMGGYYTLDEVWQKLDEMISEYPNLISIKDSIGATVENRPIYALRISDNPNIDEDEPEVLYTALHHAREPESMMQMIYFMFYLLENYGTDAEVTYLVENREMYFIPVVNPDGYKYNETTNPNGGGMWRKNRRNNGGSFGVDLNRNYGYEWNYNNVGSSGSPSSSTYRGTAGFSEPETEAVRQYCIAHNFRLALNYHTYSNLLIVPWGFKPEETPDSIFYREIASDMTQYNNYIWGHSAAIIYEVNGDSDDWFYGEETEKNKIFAMTPEVGSSFWPTQDKIIPLAEENVFPNLYLAWVAGGFVNTQSIVFDEEYYMAGEGGFIWLNVKNKGLEDISDISLSVSSNDNVEILEGSSITIGTINSQTIDTLTNAIKFRIKDSALAGDSANFEIKYYANNLLMATNNYSFIIGRPEIYFSDSLSTLDSWIAQSNVSKNWELTENSFYSTPSSVTDSRVGKYKANAVVTLESKTRIDLTPLDKPYLKFKTMYNIESGWDYGQVSISTDSVLWQPIGGGNSKLGSGNFQPSNELIYDGSQSEWFSEIINISSYGGKEVFIRFQLNTDEYVQEDGWYIDDIEIFEYTNIIVSVNVNEVLPTEFRLSQNYPNPFNPSTTIKYSIPSVQTPLLGGVGGGLVTLKIYDILGREVATLVNKEQKAGNYEVQFSTTSGLTSGIYFYRLQSGDFAATKKLILLK